MGSCSKSLEQKKKKRDRYIGVKGNFMVENWIFETELDIVVEIILNSLTIVVKVFLSILDIFVIKGKKNPVISDSLQRTFF